MRPCKVTFWLANGEVLTVDWTNGFSLQEMTALLVMAYGSEVIRVRVTP